MKAQAVKDWRKKTKLRMINSFGAACGICGYNKSAEALHFHHVNPDEKEFSLAGVRANPKKWEDIVKELRKCVLLCANCHSEVHHSNLSIPENVARFNEEYVNYKLVEGTHKRCSTESCTNIIPASRTYCFKSCELKSRRNQIKDSDLIEVKRLREEGNMTYTAIAKIFEKSDKTIAKWYKMACAQSR